MEELSSLLKAQEWDEHAKIPKTRELHQLHFAILVGHCGDGCSQEFEWNVNQVYISNITSLPEYIQQKIKLTKEPN